MALEQRVLHYARVWRETEKSAMCATEGQKNSANRRHGEAKANLRDAIDRLTRSDP
ncbi:MAG: hypothetical protein ACXV99_12735 [Candidatus Angelobacter sp.]